MNARAATSAATEAHREAAKTPKPRIMPTWAIVTISVIFGLFYAYFVWNAVDFSSPSPRHAAAERTAGSC